MTYPSSHLPSSPPHPHLHSLEAVTMGSVKGVGSSLGIAIMDVDMLDRAPKRPWADVLTPTRTRGGCATVSWSGGRGQGNNTNQDRTVAEADMKIIRMRRALTTLAAASALSSGGGGTGGGKNKYRKRTVSLSICLSTLCVVLIVVAARDPSWQVSFSQYSRDAAVGTGTGWTLCNACGLNT